ncbi:MAG: hypothetical protein PCFJNLEI_00717 [Verrucomicrobiae bacterium]|nr:hypothetical protein [Verrucomicrobiae bacterium]
MKKLLWLALLTALVHGAFGVYYVTKDEALPAKLSLRLRGEAFLAAFPSWNSEREGDAAVYNRAAMEALATGIPRTRSGAVFTHAPMYAYFLAGCYGLGGVGLLSVAVGQAILAGLTCWLVGRTVQRIAGNLPLAGLLGGVLILVNVRLAMYVAYINPTILLLFWVALALLATAEKRLLLFTLAIGCGIFTQAAFFVIGVGAAGWLLLQAIREKRLAPAVAAVGLGLVAVVKVASSQYGTPTDAQKARDNPSLVIWEANNPYYESLGWLSLWERRPGNPWTQWQASPVEQQRYVEYLERAKAQRSNPGVLWIKENPREYAKLCWVRFYTALGPCTGQMSPRNRAISTVVWLVIFPAGFWGWWKYRQTPTGRFALWLITGVTLFSTLVIVEWYLRYRLPVDLTLTVFAAGWLASKRAPDRR